MGDRELDGVLDQLVEPQRPGLLFGVVSPGQLGEVADQIGQLLHLGEHVGDEDLAIGLGELVDPAYDLEVRPQARERGP